MCDLSIVLLVVDLSQKKMQIDRLREEDVERSCGRWIFGDKVVFLRRGNTQDQNWLKNER